MIAHTSIDFFQIGEMTIPQIEAILSKLGKHISLKIGVPLGAEEKPKEPEQEHTVEEGMIFASLFAGLE